MSADKALSLLLAGNERHVKSAPAVDEDTSSRRSELANAQHPFATVFSCVDSRVAPELVFDCELGDVFVARTAGQVVDHAALGSLEYGIEELKTPLLVVMGHESCGAVKAALESALSGHKADGDIEWLLSQIRPVLGPTATVGDAALDRAVRANIARTVARLRESHIIKTAVDTGGIKIVSMYYNLHSGVVEVIS